jgi:hypothetical protein
MEPIYSATTIFVETADQQVVQVALARLWATLTPEQKAPYEIEANRGNSFWEQWLIGELFSAENTNRRIQRHFYFKTKEAERFDEVEPMDVDL